MAEHKESKTAGRRAASIPSANVDQDGHCTEPAHAESVRFNTGDACVDGLNWPDAGKDVPISAKDGSLEGKAK